jgi:aspartyl protease/PDZ domain-containing protein
VSRALGGLVWLSIGFGFGCGGGGGGASSSGFSTMGMPGIPSPARVGANLVFAEVTIDAQPPSFLLIDTGSPVTLVDPTMYPAISFPAQTPQVTVSIAFGGFTVDNVPALQTTFLGNGGATVPEIVGGNLMQQFPVQLDYSERDPNRAFRIGASNMTATGVEVPGGQVAFTLAGGGREIVDMTSSATIDVPATRIPITVDIEGVSHPFILDTGASEVTVRESVYAALTADGRPQLSGLPIGTAAGARTATVTRARTITVGGQTVVNAPVMTIGDQLIDGLETELGRPMDGLLGGSYLREFLVTVDYPHGSLQLQRYAPPAVIQDEFKRVGFELGTGSGAHAYAVAVVYPGTDAEAKGIHMGDVILSVDGQDLDNLDPISADEALDGMAGTTKQIGLGATAVPSLANTTIAVRVDDLIPVPQVSTGH